MEIGGRSAFPPEDLDKAGPAAMFLQELEFAEPRTCSSSSSSVFFSTHTGEREAGMISSPCTKDSAPSRSSWSIWRMREVRGGGGGGSGEGPFSSAKAEAAVSFGRWRRPRRGRGWDFLAPTFAPRAYYHNGIGGWVNMQCNQCIGVRLRDKWISSADPTRTRKKSSGSFVLAR